MNKLKYYIVGFIILDLILVFPVMLYYEKFSKIMRVSANGIPEVFTTLVVEITLLALTSFLAYLVSRLLKGTPLSKALYYMAWGVLMYGIGDTHLLVWMYTGVESVYPFLGKASSSIAHAFGVGAGFILVILGLYKIALARNSILSSNANE